MLTNIKIPKSLNPDPTKTYLTFPYESNGAILLLHVPTDNSFPIFDYRNYMDLELDEFFKVKEIERPLSWNLESQNEK